MLVVVLISISSSKQVSGIHSGGNIKNETNIKFEQCRGVFVQIFDNFEASYHACMIIYPLCVDYKTITNCPFRIYDVLHKFFSEMSFRVVKKRFPMII